MDTHFVIKLGNVWLYISGPMSEALRKQIQSKLSFVVPGFKYTPTYKAMVERAEKEGRPVEWDGTKTLARMTPYGLRCPSGLLSYIKEIFTERKITWEFEEYRSPIVRTEGWSVEGFTLFDYQDAPNQEIKERKRGVVEMSTGGGKTKMMMKNIVDVAAFPAVFYVPNTDLLRQTHHDFMEHVRYNGQPAEIGMVGDGHYDIRPITICTVQMAQIALEGKFTKYEFDDEGRKEKKIRVPDEQRDRIAEMVRTAQYVYIDECQHVSSDTIQSVLNNSHGARFRIGGSASPWRDDGLDLLIEACFGKRLCKVDASFLIRRQPPRLIRPQITFNHFRWFLGHVANYQELYTRFVVENDARNEWIAQRAQYHVGMDRPTIILVKWARHASILKDMIPGSEVLTSTGDDATTAKQRKLVLDRMRERKLMCIIGTTLLDEGIDIPSAGAGIFAGAGKSSTRALQRVGSFIRVDPNDPDKKIAYIEEFYDHCRWLNQHAQARRRIYETEPEFQISDNADPLGIK